MDDLPAPYTDSENRLDIKKRRRFYEDKLDAATEVFDDTRDRLINRYVAMEQITDEKDERLKTFKRELNVKNEFFRKALRAHFPGAHLVGMACREKTRRNG